MTWYDVDDILYDGEKEEIDKVKCPDCGGHIHFSFDADTFTKKCMSCGTVLINSKSPKPNCVEIYGHDHII